MDAAAVLTLYRRLEEALREQTQAAHAGDAGAIARLGERCLDLLSRLQAEIQDRAGAETVKGLDGEALRRLRDMATYNQLLLRYGFTSWAAARLDRERERRALGYNAAGQLDSQASARARASTGGKQGQLKRGVI